MTCTGTEDCHRKQGLGEMNRQRSGVDRQMESGNGDFACGHLTGRHGLCGPIAS
jgi:hypothetical protein